MAHVETISRDLRSFIARQQIFWMTPAVAAGVLAGDESLSFGLGVTSLDDPRPVNANTMFPIASITKTFTATALMALVDRGKVSLDDRVRDVLTDLRLQDAGVLETVTVRDLLCHTVGWAGGWFYDHEPSDPDGLPLAALPAAMVDVPQVTPPGIYSYSNSAYSLAGRVLEALTDQQFNEALSTLICRPLGLARTTFTPEPATQAIGHAGSNAREPHPTPVRRRVHHWPNGGLVSTATDLLQWARFHLSDGIDIASRESLAYMQSPIVVDGSSSDSVGVAWQREDRIGATEVGHAGALTGCASTLALIPEQHLALAVLATGPLASNLVRTGREWFLTNVGGLPAIERTGNDRPDDDLAEYTGTFITGATDRFELAVDRGHLVYRPAAASSSSAGLALRFYDTDHVISSAGRNNPARRGIFGRDPDGSVEWFRFLGRVSVREPGARSSH